MPASRDVIAIDASRGDATVRTGTEWYSYELIRAMSALTDRPPLLLYHRDSDGEWAQGSRVRHRRINAPRLWTHLGLSWATLRDRPRALFVPSHVVPLIHPAASVVTIHDLGYLREPQAHTRSARLMLDITTRWNARVTRRIVAISHATADDLVHNYEVDRDKIRVVYSGVRLDRFRPVDPHAVLQRLGVTSPYLLFVGTVQPRKNVIRLIEALETLHEPDLQLVIAGKPGWLAEPIEDRMRASPSVANIVRLGYIGDDDLPALYSGASAFILPSLYEGFGMPILEAMACGAPVVVSAVSSMPEVAGDAAVLVAPDDPTAIAEGIRKVLQPVERDRLRERGFRRAGSFTWTRAAKETLQVIDEARRGA